MDRDDRADVVEERREPGRLVGVGVDRRHVHVQLARLVHRVARRPRPRRRRRVRSPPSPVRALRGGPGSRPRSAAPAPRRPRDGRAIPRTPPNDRIAPPSTIRRHVLVEPARRRARPRSPADQTDHAVHHARAERVGVLLRAADLARQDRRLHPRVQRRAPVDTDRCAARPDASDLGGDDPVPHLEPLRHRAAGCTSGRRSGSRTPPSRT